jgi:phosphatidylcholine synthase
MAQMENVYLEPGQENWSLMSKAMAWSAHLLTATGAVWGLFSILAISNHQWLLAFVWMAVAVLIDSFDGLWARRVRVKRVLPNFDGALLDNIIDFLNYVVVPVYFLYESEMLPSQYALSGAALILLASAYQFCQGDAKTDDHYFKGFPSYWNIMVYYMFVLSWNGWVNLAVTVLLSALVFVPIKYVYPTRTAIYQRLTMTLACIWGIVNVIILVRYPIHDRWLIWASLLFVIYYCWLSLYSMMRTRKAA